jgi:hypothetical protein
MNVANEADQATAADSERSFSVTRADDHPRIETREAGEHGYVSFSKSNKVDALVKEELQNDETTADARTT